MSSNTYPKITIRKINQTLGTGIGGGQSLLSPQMVTVNSRTANIASLLPSSSSPSSTTSVVAARTGQRTPALSNSVCYILPATASVLPSTIVTPHGLTTHTPSNTTFIQTTGQNIAQNYRPINSNTPQSISIRIGDRFGLIRSPIFTSPSTISPRSSLNMPSNEHASMSSINSSLETSLLSSSASPDKKVFTIIKSNKRSKKLPSKFREESLLQQPPAQRQKTPKASKTPKTPKRTPKTPKEPKPKLPRGRKRKLESLLVDPNDPNSVADQTVKEKNKRGRKPKAPEVTPGMKKTKARASLKVTDKKNKTSLVPLSRISQIMRSVPSLTTLKPDAIAVSVYAAELFVKTMIEKTSENSEDSSVLKLKTFQEYLDNSSYDFLKPFAPKKMKASDALSRQKAFVEIQNAKRLGLHLENGEDEDDDEGEEDEDAEDEDEENEDDDEDENDTNENGDNHSNSEGNEQNDDDEENDDEDEDEDDEEEVRSAQQEDDDDEEEEDDNDEDDDDDNEEDDDDNDDDDDDDNDEDDDE